MPSLLDGLAVRSLVRMPISDSEQINISRCMDEKQVNELARFFIENVEISYISHSEVQIGRAISENPIISSLGNCLSLKIRTSTIAAIQNAPSGRVRNAMPLHKPAKKLDWRSEGNKE